MSSQNQNTARYAISRVLRACILSACASGAASADALLEEPFALSNQSPLVQRFNLPGMRSGQLLAPDTVQWRASINVANNFVRDTSGPEALVLDGESQRYEFGLRYGVGPRWEIGVMLPWIAYNGGTLDSFINGWHSFWGLPDHHRSDFATRKLQFMHQSRGQTDFNFDRAETGVGDMQLQIANQLLQTERDSVALITSVNLPTGDEKKLTGTDGTSIAIALAATRTEWLNWPLTLSANLGVQTLPQGDVLDDRQKTSAWFGSGEIAWAVTQDWRLRAQLNTHSAIYDSELTSLGATSTQILLGGSVRVSPRWVLDAVVSEDIVVDTAPDVTFQLALKTRY
jgi:hypothetical protein